MWVLLRGMVMEDGRRRREERWEATSARKEVFFALEEKAVRAFEGVVVGEKRKLYA